MERGNDEVSRIAFMVGLVLSGALHFWLLRPSTGPSAPVAAENVPPGMPVIETELARAAVIENEPATPEPAPAPPPSKEVEPAPLAQAALSAEPPAEPTVDQVALERLFEPVAPDPEPDPVTEPEIDPPSDKPEEQVTSEVVERADPIAVAHDPPLSSSADSSLAALRLKIAAATARRDAAAANDAVSVDAASARTQGPELRIDWGDRAAVLKVLQVGNMKLAVLRNADPGPMIVDEVAPGGGAWSRAPYRQPASNRFSNRLRVVDDVPAFSDIRRAVRLRPDERLVVLVPSEVERTLQTAQISAAFKAGMTMESIRSFGGRFSIRDDRLEFEVSQIQTRSSVQ